PTYALSPASALFRSEFQAASLAGDRDRALALQDKLAPLHDAMFVETSPGPVKYAASLLGHCLPDLRLPTAPVSDRTREGVPGALERKSTRLNSSHVK